MGSFSWGLNSYLWRHFWMPLWLAMVPQSTHHLPRHGGFPGFEPDTTTLEPSHCSTHRCVTSFHLSMLSMLLVGEGHWQTGQQCLTWTQSWWACHWQHYYCCYCLQNKRLSYSKRKEGSTKCTGCLLFILFALKNYCV